MTKQEITKKIRWLMSDSGNGLGISPVQTILCQSGGLRQPQKIFKIKKDGQAWSVVAVVAPMEKYTTEELKKIVKFSNQQTKCHLGSWNLIIIEKWYDMTWSCKFLSWERNEFFTSLDDVLTSFSPETETQ